MLDEDIGQSALIGFFFDTAAAVSPCHQQGTVSRHGASPPYHVMSCCVVLCGRTSEQSTSRIALKCAALTSVQAEHVTTGEAHSQRPHMFRSSDRRRRSTVVAFLSSQLVRLCVRVAAARSASSLTASASCGLESSMSGQCSDCTTLHCRSCFRELATVAALLLSVVDCGQLWAGTRLSCAVRSTLKAAARSIHVASSFTMVSRTAAHSVLQSLLSSPSPSPPVRGACARVVCCVRVPREGRRAGVLAGESQ